jgi:hypothetical protein
VVAKLDTAGLLSDEVLRNGAYEIPYVGPIQLSNGSYERSYGGDASKTNTVGYMQAAFGDLNKDGSQDAAVIVSGNSGTPDTFMYLVAVTNRSNTLRQAAHALLGDHLKLESVAIAGGKIIAKTLGFAANDATCCPSVQTTQTFTLQGNTLTQVR